MLSPNYLLQHVTQENVVAWLLVANIITFLLFYADKQAAKNYQYRISEKMLLLWCMIGGSIGGYLAMRYVRHKSQKQPFRQQFFMIVILQVVVVLVALSDGV